MMLLIIDSIWFRKIWKKTVKFCKNSWKISKELRKRYGIKTSEKNKTKKKNSKWEGTTLKQYEKNNNNNNSNNNTDNEKKNTRKQ